MKSKYSWFDESGGIIIKTVSQEELVKSTEARLAYHQYLFFMNTGKEAAAKQIMQNVEEAMQLAYERDMGTGTPAALDTKGPGFTK